MTSLQFLITLTALIALDSLWLGIIAKKIYGAALAPFMQDGFMRLWVWVGVRVIMIIGIVAFVWPKTIDGSRYMAFVRGAIFGWILYAVYNGTNYAFFPKRPLHIVIIDTLRGMFACGMASLVWYGLQHI